MLGTLLLTLLVCPRTKEPLIYFPRGLADLDEAEGFLFSPTARLRFRIDDGVPVLRIKEAVEVTEDEAAVFYARARQLRIVGRAPSALPG